MRQQENSVMYVADGSGLALPNCKFIADELADYFLGEFLDHKSYQLTPLLSGKPVIPPNFLFLPDRAGVKISWWTWIKFIFMVAIPNIRSILNNLPSSRSKTGGGKRR